MALHTEIFAFYIAQANIRKKNFEFTITDDTIFFQELIQFVFFPDGLKIIAFNKLVKEKALKRYTSIKAAKFMFFEVNKLVTALDFQLQMLLIKDVWQTIPFHAALYTSLV